MPKFFIGLYSFLGMGFIGNQIEKTANSGYTDTVYNKGVNRLADPINETMQFRVEKDKNKASKVIMQVYTAMEEKGYDPVNQIVGYLISGDPTYITSYNNARYMIRTLERDELLEELVRFYAQAHEED